jgi:hypothetical protein
MSTVTLTPPLAPASAHRFDRDRLLLGTTVVTAGGGVVAGACVEPRWLAASVVALGLFFALKLLTLHGSTRGANAARIFAYLALWPGMNARTFLGSVRVPRPEGRELAFALAKLAFGLVLVAWSVTHAFSADPLCMGWIGMLGVIFIFHFGIFHVLSWNWRRAGVDAPPLMRFPAAGRSLSEFWGVRWNTAFSTLARRFVLRPLGRRWGLATAGGAVFLMSGLIHELAISLPARGGWGGPTLYFLIQGAGVVLEKRTGRSGRVWTLLVTALPMPLLFHAPLIVNVVVPLFRFLKEVL